MKRFLVAAAAALSLTACSAIQSAENRVSAVFGGAQANPVLAQIACQVDGVVYPVAQTVLNDMGLGTVASLDAALVHPKVVSWCAGQGGKPVVVSPTAPVVAPTPAAPAAVTAAPAASK